MKVELDNLVSMKEANQNFSKVARMVDKDGAVVILKKNIPKYKVLSKIILHDTAYCLLLYIFLSFVVALFPHPILWHNHGHFG